MTKPIARDPIYRQRALDAEVIELCVRWYITYRLSYRDLVEMMAERGGICVRPRNCRCQFCVVRRPVERAPDNAPGISRISFGTATSKEHF